MVATDPVAPPSVWLRSANRSGITDSLYLATHRKNRHVPAAPLVVTYCSFFAEASARPWEYVPMCRMDEQSPTEPGTQLRHESAGPDPGQPLSPRRRTRHSWASFILSQLQTVCVNVSSGGHLISTTFFKRPWSGDEHDPPWRYPNSETSGMLSMLRCTEKQYEG